jgi:hypothetical protein
VAPGCQTVRVDRTTPSPLSPIAGVPAEIWVEPSQGHLFWLRLAPALFGPAGGTGAGLARWWAIGTVAPATNVTGLNLRYQSYLSTVFHRTRLARAGHAVCLPVIVTALLAVLDRVRLPGAGPASAATLGAAALMLWWGYWAVRERAPLWGGCSVALVVALYLAAHAVVGLAAAGPLGAAPAWAWLLLASLAQALSHLREPLPPRVTRSAQWVPVGEYLRGPVGRRHRTGTVLRRAGQLAAQTLFGTVDELVASPRLLPVLVLEVMWRLGYDPARRSVYKAYAARAIASGNPALDFIGTGGSTPLAAPGRLSLPERDSWNRAWDRARLRQNPAPAPAASGGAPPAAGGAGSR